jgi:hypothetical protein
LLLECPRQAGHGSLLRSERNSVADGIEQSLVFGFSHRALLRLASANSQNSFGSKLNGSLKLYRIGDRGWIG